MALIALGLPKIANCQQHALCRQSNSLLCCTSLASFPALAAQGLTNSLGLNSTSMQTAVANFYKHVGRSAWKSALISLWIDKGCVVALHAFLLGDRTN
jgi:hypothetical protein